jgi:hypothetical protein
MKGGFEFHDGMFTQSDVQTMNESADCLFYVLLSANVSASVNE